MKSKPILFSEPMIRAILNGTKTETRRVVSLPEANGFSWESVDHFELEDGLFVPFLGGAPMCGPSLECPYGLRGDRLWVRETHWYDVRDPQGCVIYAENPMLYRYQSRAVVELCDSGHTTAYLEKHEFWRRRPSIFMPRWASRIKLLIRSSHIERLQKIDEPAAVREGFKAGYGPLLPGGRISSMWTALDRFKELWQKLNGKRGKGWGVNPWVWVESFKVLSLPMPAPVSIKS